jgi:uncharacterized protein (TIGR00369 family)
MTATSSAFGELLGILATSDEGGAPICTIHPGEAAMGRPSAMHGGAVATLLEQAGRAAAAAALADGEGAPATIKLVSITVDYLRAGPMRASRARGEIVKMGGRVINIAAKAWADDPGKPYAAARLTFLVAR